jgi:methanogenic corrinoid protein MtbC1
MANGFDPPHSAPLLLVTTPAGDQHELGAMLVGVLAATEGWRVDHLGANLPATDVLAAASQAGASVVALSAVYSDPADDLVHYVGELRSGLGDEVALVVGGAAAAGVSARIEATGAQYLDELASLRDFLRMERSSTPA